MWRDQGARQIIFSEADRVPLPATAQHWNSFLKLLTRCGEIKARQNYF
jgi:hypothetical protein